MKPDQLKYGEIVQLDPSRVHRPEFAGCLMVVTEPKSWGAVGYVESVVAGLDHPARFFYRASWEEMERTGGQAVWIETETGTA